MRVRRASRLVRGALGTFEGLHANAKTFPEGTSIQQHQHHRHPPTNTHRSSPPYFWHAQTHCQLGRPIRLDSAISLLSENATSHLFYFARVELAARAASILDVVITFHFAREWIGARVAAVNDHEQNDEIKASILSSFTLACSPSGPSRPIAHSRFFMVHSRIL